MTWLKVTGCSMGEEPYTIAILINEIFEKEDLNLNLNIFATDIDSKALKKAKEAVYSFESIYGDFDMVFCHMICWVSLTKTIFWELLDIRRLG